jgi:hypothetical protein
MILLDTNVVSAVATRNLTDFEECGVERIDPFAG